MQDRRSLPAVFLALAALLAALPAAAQTAASGSTPAAPTSGADRMFLNFYEEATVIDGQWWEGRVEVLDFDSFDANLVRGIAAFGLAPNLEVGGSVGFGSTDADAGPDGSGATDLDAYAKYYFGSRDGKTEFAAGGIVTVPTGDDTAGLGYDAFALGGFGSLRYRLKRVILGGNLGLRFNGDASIFGSPDADGKLSTSLGFGAIIPLGDRLSAIGETRYETEKFEDGDAIFSVLAGLNWRISNRGQVRISADFGLDDGAPDWRFTGGYAHAF